MPNGQVDAGLRDKGAQIELLLALLFALAKLVQRVLEFAFAAYPSGLPSGASAMIAWLAFWLSR